MMMLHHKNQDLQHLHTLINEYQCVGLFGEIINKKTDAIATQMFLYFDKLIMGIIHSPKYQFYRFFKHDVDDLFQEGRSAIIKSINKNVQNQSINVNESTDVNNSLISSNN